ncbi:MFS transporter [Eubacteriaceae bacterium ES2]|nr:MFS transporter [Eubacteriaceae bacterium ES2]
MKTSSIKLSILSLAALCTISMTASAVLADIQAYFTGIDASLVQMILTIPPLLGVVFAFASGPLSMKIPKRKIIMFGLISGFLGGVIAFVFGSISIYILLFSSLLIGIAQGINSTMTMALIADYFKDDESSAMMGLQSAFVNGGGMVLVFLAGMLASIHWNYSYLVYLFFIPVMFIILKTLPKEDPVHEHHSEQSTTLAKLNSTIFFTAFVFFFYGVFQFVFQANISAVVIENGFGNASTTGLINTVFSGAGMLTGILFGQIQRFFKKQTLPFALVVVGIGMGLVVFAGHLSILFIAAICGGFALASIMPSGTFIAANAVIPQLSATAIAIVTASVNLGMFLSPIILNQLSILLGSGDLSTKYQISAVGLLTLSVISFIGYNFLNRPQSSMINNQ